MHATLKPRNAPGELSVVIEFPPGLGRNLIAATGAIGAWIDGFNADEGTRRCARYMAGLHASADGRGSAGVGPTHAAPQRPSRPASLQPRILSPGGGVWPATIRSCLGLLISGDPGALSVVREKERARSSTSMPPRDLAGILVGKQLPYCPGDGELRLAHLMAGTPVRRTPQKASGYGPGSGALTM